MQDSISNMTDEELIHSLKILAKGERSRTVVLLKHLKEMDRRSLAEKNGFPSLFDYCVRELRFAHGTASRRIHAARAAAKFTILYRTIERGLLSVTTVSLLAPHLTWDNHRRLVRSACEKSAREVEEIIAGLGTAPAPSLSASLFYIGSTVTTAPTNDPDLFSSPITSTGVPPETPRIETVTPPNKVERKTLRVQFSFHCGRTALSWSRKSQGTIAA